MTIESECRGRRGVGTESHHLWAFTEKIQYPPTQLTAEAEVQLPDI